MKKTKPNWRQRKKLNNPDADLIQTKNGKITIKEYFKILEEERNAKH